MLLHHQDRRLIAAIHLIQNNKNQTGVRAKVAVVWGKLCHMFWTVISGSDISREARIAASVRFPHLNGVVVHRSAVVEDNCMIMQQVTFGQTATSGAPHVCCGAYIGAGAKVLGSVKIGANAMVLEDIPKYDGRRHSGPHCLRPIASQWTGET